MKHQRSVKSEIENKNGFRSFGFLVAAIPLIAFFYILYSSGEFKFYLAAFAFIVAVISIVKPSVFGPFHNLWINLGLVLSVVITPLVMGLTYFLLMVPLGLLINVFKRDLVGKKIDKEADSYWITREEEMGSMRDQF